MNTFQDCFIDNGATEVVLRVWVELVGAKSYQSTTMMTSSSGNIFPFTGHLCGEFTGPRWIPRTKASDAELWCFLWSAPE